MKKIAFVLALCAVLAISKNSYSQIVASVQIGVAPPALPVYVQPACPVEGYLWSPGYWAYANGDYYWVPGVWVAPPYAGLLWTPGYWGFVNGVYVWNAGYWGPHVGFYGGVCYGYGYGGSGFYGGRWQGGVFQYNTAVVRVNTTVIHRTYVGNSGTKSGSRASFNGRGGVNAQPTAAERAAMSEKHVQATSAQQSHQVAASKDRNQFASVNKGKPSTTAMNKVNGQRFSQEGHAAASASTASHTSTHTAAHTTTNRPVTSTPAQHTNATVHHAAPSAQHNNVAPQHNTVSSQHSHAAPQHTTAPPRHTSSPSVSVQPRSHPAAAQQHISRPPQQHAAPPHSAPPMEVAAELLMKEKDIRTEHGFQRLKD